MATEFYLLPFQDVDVGARFLADHLDIEFEARESDYLGGDYCCWGPAKTGRDLIIRRNDDFGDGPFVSGADETAILLVVDFDRDQAPAVWDKLHDLIGRRLDFVSTDLMKLPGR